MSSTWHRLHLSDKNLPPLLFQFTGTQEGYEIYLTDLTYIWSERLTQKQIIKQAEENNTTIDPGEDLEQIDVLLEKIEEALQKGKGSVILSSGTEADSLYLQTTTKLPAPLKPLKWELNFSKEPSSYLTSKILLPLLKEESNWELRQRDLLQHLKQKDIVLNKLLEKIETIGADLGTIFPSAVGSRKSRKGVTRSEAARFVKGIEPFEEQAWLANAGSSNGGLAASLLQGISEPGDNQDFSIPGDEWWRQLTGVPESNTREESQTSEEMPYIDKDQNKTVPQSHIESDNEATASSDDDDEFQRQETPPRMKSESAKPPKSPPRQKAKSKSPSPAPPPIEEEDEATASDTDPEPEPKPTPARRRNHTPSISKSPEPPARQSQEEPKKKKGGLGSIGGKKPKEKETQAQDQSRNSPKPQAQNSPEKPTNNDPPASSASPTGAGKAKRVGKLGMIGGKAKAKDPVPTHTSPTVPEAPAMSPDQESCQKDAHASPDSPKESVIKGSPMPVSAIDDAPTADPETEEQRADRRREELKRSLEAKSKAPAKKKRRF